MRSAHAARWGLIAILAAVAPLAYLFTASDKLASFGDDSASYLVLAHYFLGAAGNSLAAAWAPWHSHFPPLLPLLLALSGGANDLRIGHALVAAMGVLALPLVHRYAARQLDSTLGGWLVAVLFMLTPTAWISLKGILSEPLFLLLAVAALAFFEARIADGRGAIVDYVVFGLLLGGAFLARVLGFALVLAYAIHVVVALVRGRAAPRARMLLPFVPWIVLAGLWYALRPVVHTHADTYASTLLGQIGDWRTHPLRELHRGGAVFLAGWVASFMAEGNVAAAPTIVLALLGCLALAGMALRIAANRLDGWYVLISLAVIFPWVFSPDNTRRLLYPLLPPLMVFAAGFLAHAARRLGLAARRRVLLYGAFAGLLAALTLPAMTLLFARSRDREPVIPGSGYTYRDVTEYYTTIDLEEARKRVRVVVATLAGLEAIDRVTPPDAKVMWMRPEYVALLGHRRGVPFLYRWDRHTLAARIRASGATHVVVCWIYKTDLLGEEGDPLVDTAPYGRPVLRLGGGDVFTLMRVDRESLDRYLAAGA